MLVLVALACITSVCTVLVTWTPTHPQLAVNFESSLAELKEPANACSQLYLRTDKQ